MLKEAWTLALETMSWMQMRKLSEPSALAKTIKQLDIRDHDAIRLAHLLVSETVRRLNVIDAYVNATAKPNSISEFDLGVQAFLRLYVYQTRVAKNWSKVNVEEAENIAKMARSILGWKTIQGVERFLGALLTQEPMVIFQGKSDEGQTGLRTFHPTWFVRYCFRLFGRDKAIAILEKDTVPSYIRLNTLKMQEKEILDRLAVDGVDVEKVGELRFAYLIKATKRTLTDTSSFRDGLFCVQDKTSCLAVEAASQGLKTDVFDVCAAPGIKTTHLAQLMQNRGILYSLDYSRRRMAVWKREVARMGVEIAAPIVVDVCNRLPMTFDADVTVLDPPSTNTGTLAKSSSSRWRLTPRLIDRIADVQWKMIDNCAEHVRHGGTLVYSTSSITVEENEMIIEGFLKWHSDFSLSEITPKIGSPGLRGLDKCQRFYPNLHQCNGAFIAKLVRNRSPESL